METVRAFFALELPEDLRRRISEVAEDVADSGADVKAVEFENLHVTMKFLGDVPTARVEEIATSIGTIRSKRFEIEAKGVGVFPDRQMIRVIWVGVGRGGNEIVSLSREIDGCLVGLGFPRERRFIPHITIGRVRSPRNKERLLNAIDRHRDAVFGTCVIDRLVLKKSVLTSHGPVYSNLKVFPLE